MSESKIKYRNGFPTKKSLYKIRDDFDTRMYHLHVGHDYGKTIGRLVWQDKYTQSRINEFIEHLHKLGIQTGKFNSYESPIVGQLELLKKEQP